MFFSTPLWSSPANEFEDPEFTRTGYPNLQRLNSCAALVVGTLDQGLTRHSLGRLQNFIEETARQTGLKWNGSAFEVDYEFHAKYRSLVVAYIPLRKDMVPESMQRNPLLYGKDVRERTENVLALFRGVDLPAGFEREERRLLPSLGLSIISRTAALCLPTQYGNRVVETCSSHIRSQFHR